MDFKKAVKKLFVSSPGSVLGIDLGSEFVKIVQVDLKGSRPQVKDFVITELPANLKANGLINSKDEMASFLHDLINRHNFSTKHAIFSINGKNAFVREITMPIMSDEELKQAVTWDAGQYVPYETDTYYMDFAKFGSLTQDGQQPIVLVAAPKEIVDSIVEISDLLSLKILKIDIDVLSICRTLGKEFAEFILLDIGLDYSMMTIFQSGAPVAQRALQQGWENFISAVADVMAIDGRKTETLITTTPLLIDVDGEYEEASLALKDAVNSLVHECRLTSDYYITNKRETVFTHLVLAGAGSAVPGLSEYISRDSENEVITHDILKVVDFNSKFDKKKVKTAAPVLAVAVGAALAGGEFDD
ncbi:MAG: type IV pilus assembly protein PilM [Acidaminococcaceae bacterium]